MKPNYCIALILITLLPITRVLAQGSLLFIDGNKIQCATVDYTSDSTKINYTVINKTKIKKIPRDQFFSYTPTLGNEIVFYSQDTLGENELNERQMRMFIIGQQDARTHYKTPVSIVGGALFGAASGFFLTPLLSPLGTVPFIVINGSRLIKVNPKKVYNRLYLAEENYLRGYEKVARGKRVQQSLVASLAGLVVGIAASVIMDSVKK